MPFADVAGLVPRHFHPAGQGIGVQWQMAVIHLAADLRGVFAGLQGSAHGATDGLAGKGVLKTYSLRRHFIQVRRNGQFLPVAAQRIPALLVGKKENNIRFHTHASLDVSPSCVIKSDFWLVASLALLFMAPGSRLIKMRNRSRGPGGRPRHPCIQESTHETGRRQGGL